jgi:uncharacterized protein YbjQ (UPF0145 family)
MNNIIVSTTNNIEGRNIVRYHGIVTGEAILGTNIFKDFLAGIRDIVGGRSGAYEKSLREAREIALDELKAEALSLGANAIVGIDLDYENISAGGNSSMLMVSASGTAVQLD